MNIEQIRKNAPNGSELYRPYTGQYLRYVGTYQHIWRDGRWESCSFDFSFTHLVRL